MNIKYKTFKTISEIENACKIGISNRLYVPCWMIRDYLTLFKKDIKKIVIAYDNEKPIALGLINNNFRFMVFVRKNYRKRGIAFSIFKKCRYKKLFFKKIIMFGHDKASCNLFTKCNNWQTK